MGEGTCSRRTRCAGYAEIRWLALNDKFLRVERNLADREWLELRISCVCGG